MNVPVSLVQRIVGRILTRRMTGTAWLVHTSFCFYLTNPDPKNDGNRLVGAYAVLLLFDSLGVCNLPCA
jgi:hypothetical protein